MTVKVSLEFLNNLNLLAEEVKKNGSSKKNKSKIKPGLLLKLTQDFEEIRKDNLNKINQLLSYEKDYSPLFCPISLFGTLDYGRLEVAHTRTIGWLISPDKEHDFGLELTKSFLKKFDIELPPEVELEKIEIETEKYLVSEENVFGRADIFISYGYKGDTINILVEAKVDSELTAEQIEKYKSYLLSIGGEVMFSF